MNRPCKCADADTSCVWNKLVAVADKITSEEEELQWVMGRLTWYDANRPAMLMAEKFAAVSRELLARK